MRLKVMWTLLRPLVSLFLKIKFGYRYEKAGELPDNYIVLSNHVTDYDPLFVGVSFRDNMRFVASGHIARWGWTYRLIDFLLSPIIREKGAPATVAIKEAMKTCKAGGNVAMFPEGVRTWTGSMSPILPSTAKLVKSLGCGLVTYRIEGAYFSSPMWSQKGTRRGKVKGSVVNVYTKEQLKVMTNEEIYKAIVDDISEDAYERQEREQCTYKGRRLAEKMESLIYICPECGAIDAMRSIKNRVVCSVCEASFTYDKKGNIVGQEKFSTVKELFDWQKEYVELDASVGNTYYIPSAQLVSIENRKETFVAKGKTSIDGENIICGDVKIALEDITEFAMHGKYALVFTANKTYYELVPCGEYNSYKFLLYYEEWKNR